MVYSATHNTDLTDPRHGRLAASRIATTSFFRVLPWFVSGRPGTPLRVLCLMAMDTVHVLRTSRRLSFAKMQTLATLLDFGACANDFFDDNDFSIQQYRATRRLLDQERTGVAATEFVNRLRALEQRRPSPRGDARAHRKVQHYRESVIRLSLGMIAATAFDDLTIDDGIQATRNDEDLETLFRIVMLCQIIDDIIDFATDTNDGLPSFLTAHSSPAHAIRLTSDSAKGYADLQGVPSSPQLFPLRVALLTVSAFTKVTISGVRWRLKWHAVKAIFFKRDASVSLDPGLKQ